MHDDSGKHHEQAFEGFPNMTQLPGGDDTSHGRFGSGGDEVFPMVELRDKQSLVGLTPSL